MTQKAKDRESKGLRKQRRGKYEYRESDKQNRDRGGGGGER